MLGLWLVYLWVSAFEMRVYKTEWKGEIKDSCAVVLLWKPIAKNIGRFLLLYTQYPQGYGLVLMTSNSTQNINKIWFILSDKLFFTNTLQFIQKGRFYSLTQFFKNKSLANILRISVCKVMIISSLSTLGCSINHKNSKVLLTNATKSFLP